MHCIHRLAVLFVAAILSVSAPADAAPAEAPPDVAAADNAFGFRLLNAVQKATHNGNVILSPVSAALDLSMLLDGAEGETRQEIQSALSLTGQSIAAINQDNAALIKGFRTPAPGITLTVADSLWVDSRHATLRPDYTQQTRAGYDAEITGLDFSDARAPARINAWASQATNGKIARVIDALGSDDRLLLLNAMYFKGEWAHKFDKTLTQQRDFTTAGGAIKQVPRMAQSGRFEYFEAPQLQAVRLPFGNGDLVMEILLPAQSFDLDAVLMHLMARWKNWQVNYAWRSGKIELPRFELKSNYRLNESLQALGMKRAFRPDAQFAGIFSSLPDRPRAGAVFVSSVRQSTYWKVDEEGSEAAAVTSIGVRAAAAARPVQPFSMIVDRPFFCAIEDRRNGALLFIAAIYDPTA